MCIINTHQQSVSHDSHHWLLYYFDLQKSNIYLFTHMGYSTHSKFPDIHIHYSLTSCRNFLLDNFISFLLYIKYNTIQQKDY